MKITGDVFIDAGTLAFRLLSSRFGGEEGALEFVFELYLTKWNKAIYSFLPNSYFTQPRFTKEQKIRELRRIYVSGDYDASHRDKIMLTGSSSFSNFYPSFSQHKADIQIIRAHLFAPLACVRFDKNPLYSLIAGNDIEIISNIWTTNVNTNIFKDYPLAVGQDVYTYIAELYKEFKRKCSFDVHSFTNYAQEPRYEVKHFDYDKFKSARIAWLFKDKELWEVWP